MITFLWDLAKGKRKYHLVNWERGMTPLKVVGVGKTNARYLKQIIVAKIVLEVCQQRGSHVEDCHK